MSDEEQQPQPAPAGSGPLGESSVTPDKDERTWAMLAHLSAFLSYWIPAGNFVGPLVVWLIKKDEMPFVDDQGKEALNFQLTLLIASLIVFALFCVGIGIFLAPVLAVYAIVMTVIAAIKANEGQYYRYPLTIRILK